MDKIKDGQKKPGEGIICLFLAAYNSKYNTYT
jgi:hypothetical protein